MNSEIKQTVAQILRDLKPNQPKLEMTPELDLFQSGILDSFGVVEFVVRLEERFLVRIPDEEMTAAHFQTISAIVAMIEKLKSDK